MRLRVLLPPLSEQRRIAAILSAVDETIDETEAVIESLQALKKVLMKELLTLTPVEVEPMSTVGA